MGEVFPCGAWLAGFVGGRGLLVGWVLLAGAVCGRVQFVGEFSLLASVGEGWRKKSALFFSLIGGLEQFA